MIIIATSAQTVGTNSNVNTAPTPPTGDTNDKGIVKPQSPTSFSSTKGTRTGAIVEKPLTNPEQFAATSQHEDEKTALIVGGVAVGLLAIWLLFRRR